MNRTRTLLAAAAIGALTVTAACSSEPKEDNSYKVAASTNVWGDVVKQLSSDPKLEVTTVIEGGAIDPHTFDPSAADMAKINEADLVVVGGGGYDAWAYNGVDSSKVIAALPLDGEHAGHDHAGHDHGDHGDHSGHDHAVNEHIWYDVHAVQHLAKDVAERLQKAGVSTSTEDFDAKLEEIHQQLHHMPKMRVAQTEPIADYLIETAELEEATPKGYRQTTLNENEPSAADVAAFLELINSGGIDVLIYNPQTETDMTKQLREAAEKKNIPVVEIRETPEKDESYLDFLSKAVNGLQNAHKH